MCVCVCVRVGGCACVDTCYEEFKIGIQQIELTKPE